jgi:hypothetical protein
MEAERSLLKGQEIARRRDRRKMPKGVQEESSEAEKGREA